MKTLLLSEVFPPRTGGSGRWFWEIYRRLPRAEFIVAAAEHPDHAAFDTDHDLRVIRLPWHFPTWGLASTRGLWAYLRMSWRLRRLLAANNVGMIHCGKCLPEGCLAWLLQRWSSIPYICYSHGEEMNLATTSQELTWLTRRVLAGAQFVIANSRNTERILREEWGLPCERVRQLHPGVDTHRFQPALRDPAERARLGWGERRVVLTVGRLQKRKGHDQMIRAVASVRNIVPDVLYAIVGDGEERSSLEAQVVAEGLAAHVQFLGELPDERLVACYQQCDLFVLPNRQVRQDIEGFGMVLVEAQSCGKPVVAGDSGGTSETMQIPETGQVVNCNGPHELSALVVDLLNNPERLAHMGTAARAWVVEHFDWEALSCKAAELFRPLARRPHFQLAREAV
jgi:phosphatidylinositol alpha-1,6-mannosyltransferase